MEVAIKANAKAIKVFDNYRDKKTQKIVSVEELPQFPFRVLGKEGDNIKIPFQGKAVWTKRHYFRFEFKDEAELPCLVFAPTQPKINATGKGAGKACS